MTGGCLSSRSKWFFCLRYSLCLARFKWHIICFSSVSSALGDLGRAHLGSGSCRAQLICFQSVRGHSCPAFLLLSSVSLETIVSFILSVLENCFLWVYKSDPCYFILAGRGSFLICLTVLSFLFKIDFKTLKKCGNI